MQQAADALLPGFGSWLLAGALLGLMSISALNFYGASLTLLSVADCFKPQRAGVGQATRRAGGRSGALDRHGAVSFQGFRRPLLRPAGGTAVPVHAVDRHQPGRLLLGAQVALFRTGDLQSARHLRALELARPAGLRRRVCGDDSRSSAPACTSARSRAPWVGPTSPCSSACRSPRWSTCGPAARSTSGGNGPRPRWRTRGWNPACRDPPSGSWSRSS